MNKSSISFRAYALRVHEDSEGFPCVGLARMYVRALENCQHRDALGGLPRVERCRNYRHPAGRQNMLTVMSRFLYRFDFFSRDNTGGRSVQEWVAS